MKAKSGLLDSILMINSGSSSLRFALFKGGDSPAQILSGKFERIGLPDTGLTFNDWHPGVTEMMALGDGRWAKELALPPGTYEYRLVADGEWMSNPAATESMRTRSGGRTPSFGWPPTQRWPVDGRGARESVAAMRSQETKSAN